MYLNRRIDGQKSAKENIMNTENNVEKRCDEIIANVCGSRTVDIYKKALMKHFYIIGFYESLQAIANTQDLDDAQADAELERIQSEIKELLSGMIDKK